MRTLTICLLLLLQQAFSFAQTPCSGGSANGFPCNNITLQSTLSVAALGGSGDGNDIWGWTDPLDGKEYAIVGVISGTSFVDISNPSSPIVLGFLPTPNTNSGSWTYWRDVKVINNYAYIVGEETGHGMQIFDLTRLRTATPGTTFTVDGLINYGNGKSHNVVSLEETGYIVAVGTSGYNNGGMTFFDVKTDPTNPTLAGSFSSDGYTHDAMCFIYRGPDKQYIGKEICIGYNEDTNTIIDATDKTNITQISRTPYAGSSYTHQGWITDDHRYMLVNDELDESNAGHNTRTYIFDISDLDNPTSLGFYDHPFSAIDHNLYIKGRYAYLANYRSGLRILDIGDIANGNLTEIAGFDTYTASNSAQFNGAWSNYPYFKSGNVIISDIEEGLLVVKPEFDHYSLSFTDIKDGVQRVCPGSSITYTLNVDDFGFTGNVNLSLSGLDPALMASLSSSSVAPGGTVTVTVTASDGVTPSCLGNFCVLLTANAGNATSEQSIAIGIIVDDQVAGCGTTGGICPSCFDGVLNQDETGIDCGGTKCDPCPSCNDGIQNQDETGIDCGGAACQACIGPCGSAIYLNCNSTISDSNASGTDDINSYPDAYNQAGFTGPERIYTFDVAVGGSVSINLSNLNDDLDIFLFDACDPTGTVLGFSYNGGTDNENINITLSPGTYYLFVDGWGNNAISSYDLSLTCPQGNCTDGIQNEGETGIDCGGACAPCPIYLSARIFLQGAFDNANFGLRNDLAAMMPTTEPYTSMGYMHVGGGGSENTLSGIINANNVVDWVVVELRDKNTPSTIVATRSALVRADGMVVSHLDGTSPVQFNGPLADDYYVAIRHRNHLGVMTNAPVTVN